MDETRLDLRAADQERMRQWEEAYRESRRTLDRVMQQGAALYPIVGRRGTIYGTRRLPPGEVNEVSKDQDEEIKKMSDQTPERVTYEYALAQALAHAQAAREYAGSMRIDFLEKSKANAQTSQAWSALASLLHAAEVREGVSAYAETLQSLGLTPTGRKRDYVSVPPVQNVPNSPAADLERANAEGKL